MVSHDSKKLLLEVLRQGYNDIVPITMSTFNENRSKNEKEICELTPRKQDWIHIH